MTHIIRHPLLQDHKKLSRAYRQMANAAASTGTNEESSVAVNTLRFMADEHYRKAHISGRRGARFIFIK
jgi:hypothetical protein